MHPLRAALSVLLVSSLVPLAAQSLAAGRPAPALHVARWLKGEPVPQLAKDRVYVVEFWATWCGPCIAGMPHLSELQQKHAAQLTVIGVTSEGDGNSLADAEAMVKQKGDTMAYTVAWDDGQKTQDAWFRAAGRESIPSCFVVDKRGTIAWIGHPQWLDAILPDVLADKHDVAALAGRIEAAEKRIQRIFLAAAIKPEKATEEADAFCKEFPYLAPQVESGMFGMMLEEHAKAARPIGERIMKRAIAAKDAIALNELAWLIVDPAAKVGERDLELAMAAATKAVELSQSKEPGLLDTLARVYAWKGDFAKALELQRRAMAVAENDANAKTQLAPALAEYEQKAKEGGK